MARFLTIGWSVLYPGLLLASLAATSYGLSSAVPDVLVVFGVIVGVAAPLVALQRVAAHREEWRATPGEAAVDLLHALNTGAVSEGWRAASWSMMYASAVALSSVSGGSVWPTHWPALLQLGLALLVGDLGAYWVHRTAHAWPLLWRVHAMHHASRRLNLWSSARNHPLNAVLAYGVTVWPVVALGAPLEVIALLSVFTAVNGMLQHVNLPMRTGWLNYVLSTADQHRLHHSVVVEESRKNLGSNVMLWDIVFGTFVHGATQPERVGLDDTPLPENFVHHLLSPFRLARYRVGRSGS